MDLTARLGRVELRTPLVAASGTVGNVVDFAGVTDLSRYGAAVAKSVSREPWSGRPAPRLAAAGTGMLNSIGIQNPGIDRWVDESAPRFDRLGVPVWGSAVGRDAGEFADVAERMSVAGLPVIEVNLSCPNLDGHLFALDPTAAGDVIRAIRSRTDRPLGAKLSPNAQDIVAVASSCREAGADWVVLTNTAWGASVDPGTRRPVVSGVIGGYSGPPLKPMAMRCVIEVHRAMPDFPILGLGGVTCGRDVVEYVLAGASAVGLGTIHFAEPRAAGRILKETARLLRRMGERQLSDLVGGMRT